MRRRRAALALCLALLLSGCGGHAEETPVQEDEQEKLPVVSAPVTRTEPAGPFTLPRSGGTLNPLLTDERTDLTLAPLLYEGLFELDENFEPVPLLCESWESSPGHLVWTLTLRENVTFSDGTVLTARIAASALNTARAGRYAARLAQVASVEALSQQQLRITLTRANGALPALLDVPIVLGGRDDPRGTGPYLLTHESEDGELTAREDWWRGLHRPAQVIPLKTVETTEALVRAFESGEVTLVTADRTGTDAPGYAGSCETFGSPTTTMLYLGYNLRRGPCVQQTLRRAIARVPDRDALAGAVYQHHVQPAVLPVSPACGLYDRTLAEEAACDPESAAALFAEAGYAPENGVLLRGRTELHLTLLVNAESGYKLRAAEQIAAELTAAGAVTEVCSLAWQDYLAELSAGNFDLYLGETALTADFDIGVLTEPGGALNYGGYDDAATSARLAEFRNADAAHRPAAAQALFARCLAAVPFTPLAFKDQDLLIRWGMASGVSPTAANPFAGLENWRMGEN